MASEDCAHISKGAEDNILITKRLRLVKRISLIETDPTDLDPTDLESVRCARVVMWLKSNPSNPASPIKISESMQMTKMVITYADDSKTPLIKDTAIVAVKNLLRNAKKVSGQIQL